MPAVDVAGSPRIDVTPHSAPADRPFQIQLSGLPPGRQVTLKAHMAGPPGSRWASQAAFRTDAAGVVDLAAQAPLGGTYGTADPTGMLWSMALAPAGETVSGPPPDPLAPRTITFALELDGQPVAETVIERLRVPPGVRRTVIRERGLVGTLFQPDAPGSRAGIILLGGAEGGLHELDAALLAGHGYAALALAYFGMEGVPAGLANIPLEYFETAASWLQAQAGVRSDRLGVLGGSRGGELALLLGATFPVFTAVVSYLGSGVMTQGIVVGDLTRMLNTARPSWTRHGQALPYLPSSTTPAFEAQLQAGDPVELGLVFEAALEHVEAVSKAAIPVERINGPVLLISARDDRSWPSTRLSEIAARRLAAHQHRHSYRHLAYDRAGHLIIQPPYGPTTMRTAPGPGVTFQMGGTTRDDAFARADAWRQTLAFFKQHLQDR